MSASSLEGSPPPPSPSSTTSNTPPDEKWSAVPGMPGVVTCPLLRQWSLGIASKWNILCCIVCAKKDRPVSFNGVRDHIAKHHVLPTSLATTTIQGHLARFGVDKRNLMDIPVPTGVVAPLPFLQEYEVYKCVPCEEDFNRHTYNRSDTRRSEHFRDVHGTHGPPELYPERVVKAQCFSASKAPRKQWFEVDPALLKVGPLADLDESDDPIDATARDLFEAYLRNYTPAHKPDLPADDFRDVMPFLQLTGWGKHVQKHDIQRLRNLVHIDAKTDPLQSIFLAAIVVFQDLQKDVDKQHEIYRTNLMDDESGSKVHAFHALTKKSRKEYARLFGRWVVFVCRQCQMEKSGEDWYPIKLTQTQRYWADQALGYCVDDRAHQKRVTLYGLATSFWLPEHDLSFTDLATDQFSDATVRFSCLVNILASGEFASPRNCCHELVRIKYVMRTVLFMWSIEYHKTAKLSLDLAVPRIASALSRRKVTPFATVSLFASHANTYASTSTHLPNVAWVTPSTVAVEGHQADLGAFFEHLGAELHSLERLVEDELMFGIDAGQCGFDITEETPIFDDISNKTPGFSLFSHEANSVFKDLQHKLAEKVFKDPRARYLHKGQRVPKTDEIVWDNIGVSRYLDCWHKALRSLGLCMHLTGGQPGRATEFVTMMWENTELRMRAIYMPAPGRMIFVLWYNKTTGQTGYDRVVVHAIPWRLARLVLMLKGLVAPFVGELVKYYHGAKARDVHNLYLFTQNGKQSEAEFLSNELRRWFTQHLKCPFGSRLYRQFAVALSRRLMHGAQRVWTRTQNLVDAQAGHTSEMANQHYAIEAKDLLRLAEEGVLMYSQISWWWWRIVFQKSPGILTSSELTRGDEAQAILTHNFTDGYGGARPGFARPVADRLQDSGLMTQLVQRLGKVLQIAGLEDSNGNPVENPPAPPIPLPKAPPAQSERAPFAEILGEHITLLQAYCKDKDASWTCREQGQALAHIIERRSSLLVVLPTGAGKSVLFGALRYYEQGVTVVVFPLRALLNNQLDAANKRDPKRPWQRWHRSLDIPAGIVASTMEDLEHTDFRQWCANYVATGRLARIVIDEVHLVPSQDKFRDVMRNLRPLIEGRVPLVGLTATMPPTLEGRLRDRLGHPTWQVIRAPTQRANLHLRTARYKSRADALLSLKALVARYTEQTPRGTGILIVVRSRAEAEDIAQQLRTSYYHSGMSNETRDEIAASWIAGKFKAIVGTSGLGTGIHHPGCRLVIHWDVPHGILNYAQETGRAGRAGDPALCVLLHWNYSKEPNDTDTQGDRPLDVMLKDSKCMRMHLSRFLDGEELMVTCFSDRFALCGRCLTPRALAETRIGKSHDVFARLEASAFLKAGELPDLIDLGSNLHAPASQFTPHQASSPLLGPVDNDMEVDSTVDNPDEDAEVDIETTSDEHREDHSRGLRGQQGSDTEMQSLPSRESSDSGLGPYQEEYQEPDPGQPPAPMPRNPDWVTVSYRKRRTNTMEAHHESRPPVRQARAREGSIRRRKSSTAPSSSPPAARYQPQSAPSPPGSSRLALGLVRPSQQSSSAAPLPVSPPMSWRQPHSPPGPSSSSHPAPRVAHRSQHSSSEAPLPVSLPAARHQPQSSVPVPLSSSRPAPGVGQRPQQYSSAVAGPSGSNASKSQQQPAPGTTSPPAVPVFHRFRQEPTSPTHRRVPSQTATLSASQVLSQAARNLVPMARTGSRVMHDAEMAIQRRTAATDPNQADEEEAGTFSVPNLLALKSVAGNWCTFCLVHNHTWGSHIYRQCGLRGGVGNFRLDHIKVAGQTYMSCRSSLEIKERSRVCYHCLWPWGISLQHPPASLDPKNPSCTVKDFVLPICWMILADAVLAQKLAQRFDLDEGKTSRPREMMAWLGEVNRRDVMWAGVETNVYNAQCVVLWLYFEERGGAIPGY
ncbi:hypothetical protein FRC06_007719, partial [Ceratobasidium sp. 370]